MDRTDKSSLYPNKRWIDVSIIPKKKATFKSERSTKKLGAVRNVLKGDQREGDWCRYIADSLDLYVLSFILTKDVTPATCSSSTIKKNTMNVFLLICQVICSLFVWTSQVLYFSSG